MKTATITISYDEEKLAALRLYLSQKNQTVEEELLTATDNLYAKTVPNNVREFIDLRVGKTVNEPKKRKAKELPVSHEKPTCGEIPESRADTRTGEENAP
ncbi:MAG: hypothetical protein IJ325_13960 [Clostridia bacterium]|nr:hypothetical protein [Clostridia bacterium]